MTLMLTYIALYLSAYAIGLWPSQSNTTRPIPENAVLPTLLSPTSLNAGVFLGVLAVAGGWFLMFRTSLGFQIRAVGKNGDRDLTAQRREPRAASSFSSFVIGGGYAGAAGAILVLGVNQALVSNLSDNLGYLGITIPLMAGLSPLGIVAAALLFSTLRAGGDAMQVATNLDPAVGDLIVAVFVITLLAFHAIRVQQVNWVRGRSRVSHHGVFTTVLVLGLGLAAPVIWATLGQLVAEQSGIINPGIEGVMLSAALIATIGYHHTESYVLATLIAVASGCGDRSPPVIPLRDTWSEPDHRWDHVQPRRAWCDDGGVRQVRLPRE